MTSEGRELLIFPDESSLFHAAAQRIAGILAGAPPAAEKVSFVLTGGGTPAPVYELLADRPLRDAVDWSRIDFLWGDERCVRPGDPESNYGMAAGALLSRLPVRDSQVHRIPAELPVHEDAARRYEAEIRTLFPGAGVPSFDLVLLGMGTDGHTASLFPGTAWDENRLVVPVYAEALRSYRISMTPRLLNAARQVLFLVAGEAKAKALRSVMSDEAPGLPAGLIRPVRGRVLWMVDRPAASLLPADAAGPK